MSDNNESILVLIYDNNRVGGVQTALDDSYDDGYGWLSMPLIDANNDSPKLLNKNDILKDVPFIYSGNANSDTYHYIIGKLSQWITFHQSSDTIESNDCKDNNNGNGKIMDSNNDSNEVVMSENGHNNEMFLKHQIDWAYHLGITRIILPPLKPEYDYDVKQSKQNTNVIAPVKYASALISSLSNKNRMRGIIPVKCDAGSIKCWRLLSSFVSPMMKNIDIGVILGENVPSKDIYDELYGMRVTTWFIDANIFLTNDKGYPVLSKAHRKFLTKFLRSFDTNIILTGEPSKPERYAQYLNHFRKQITKLNSDENASKPYWDLLQTPLQPLKDNLEFATYETFEADPIKYNKYQEAIERCLNDFKLKQNNNNNNDKSKHIVLMVLGAGRGPLVQRAINASNKTGVLIKIYAIEKNPHAIVILKTKQKYIWKNMVKIIQTDMRVWNPPEKADIIVSELLGSFGDNELSPECLDGAQKVLKPNGICIPKNYQNYIVPISNGNTWNKLDKTPKDFELPYVINLVSHDILSDIKKVWKFSHPSKNIKLNNAHNVRYKNIKFKINKDSIIHGFAGYFDSVLYKDVMLSIHPKTMDIHCKGMFSWFPIWFPLIKPINVNKNDIISFHIWRKTDNTQVWFEWCITNPILTQIHNINHRSYSVKLS